MSVRLWYCAVGISLFKVSNAVQCQANCLLFGVSETTIVFHQRDSPDECGANGEPSSTYKLLSLHNDLRQELASGNYSWPPASNMRLMQWDPQLESLAHESLALWLSTSCSLTPDKCFWTTAPEGLAMNYGIAGGSGWTPDITDIFNSWTLLPSLNALYNPEFWPRFANVMNAENVRLGCGQTVLKERGHQARFLLCYYNPGSKYNLASDFFNVSLHYELGEPCTNCPVGTACNLSSAYPLLCAVNIELQVSTPVTVDDKRIVGGVPKLHNPTLQYWLSVILVISHYSR